MFLLDAVGPQALEDPLSPVEALSKLALLGTLSIKPTHERLGERAGLGNGPLQHRHTLKGSGCVFDSLPELRDSLREIRDPLQIRDDPCSRERIQLIRPARARSSSSTQTLLDLSDPTHQIAELSRPSHAHQPRLRRPKSKLSRSRTWERVIEAWASQKSFVRKDEKRRDDDDPGNPTVNFRGEKRSNQTHASRTDPDARLAGMRGQGARLAYQGHVVTENRNGLVVAAKLTQASGYAEREAALEMVLGLGGARRITLAGDKGYDAKSFVQALRAWSVTPHVAQNTTNRRSAIDRRTTGHPGYEVSQRFRKRVEEVFGWMKTVGLMRKTRHRGTDRVGWVFTFTAAAYNLVRIRNLLEAT